MSDCSSYTRASETPHDSKVVNELGDTHSRTRKRTHTDGASVEYSSETRKMNSSEYSSVSDDIIKQRLELEAAEQRIAIKKKAAEETAKLELELVNENLKLQLSELKSNRTASLGHSISMTVPLPVGPKVRSWLNQDQTIAGCSQMSERTVFIDPNAQNYYNNDTNSLANTLKNTLDVMKQESWSQNNRVLYKLNSNLPNFDGDGLKWLHFKQSFLLSTRLGNFSDEENKNRLYISFKGAAKDAVATLLMTGAGANEIMETLELIFGNQDYILQKIVQKIKDLPILGKEPTNNILHVATKIKTRLQQ